MCTLLPVELYLLFVESNSTDTAQIYLRAVAKLKVELEQRRVQLLKICDSRIGSRMGDHQAQQQHLHVCCCVSSMLGRGGRGGGPGARRSRLARGQTPRSRVGAETPHAHTGRGTGGRRCPLQHRAPSARATGNLHRAYLAGPTSHTHREFSAPATIEFFSLAVEGVAPTRYLFLSYEGQGSKHRQ